MVHKNVKIGFIGQGWIGKNYADNFEDRGYEVVRYAKEAPHIDTKEDIATCDIVFIAVPTPTTPEGFDDSILRKVIKLVGKGKTAVIKSTLLPGRTKEIQEENPEIIVTHSPEFLSEATAREDADNPDRNIIGIPVDNEKYREAAQQVMNILPKAPFNLICSSSEAEMIKYSHNIAGYMQVMFTNMLYDINSTLESDWEVLKKAMLADPMMSHTYLNPVHKTGRGAGGACFIKDFAAFRELYRQNLPEAEMYHNIIDALEKKNTQLLLESHKDLDLLSGVYGEEKVAKYRKKS